MKITEVDVVIDVMIIRRELAVGLKHDRVPIGADMAAIAISFVSSIRFAGNARQGRIPEVPNIDVGFTFVASATSGDV